MDPICEQIEKDNDEDNKYKHKKNIQKSNNNIPIDYFSKSIIKLAPKEKSP